MTMALPALREARDFDLAVGVEQARRHYAQGCADRDDFFFGEFAEDADGPDAAHTAREPIAVEQILDVLVFGVAVAGLFDGHIGEALGIGAGGGGHTLHNGVHLFLRIRAVFLPGSERLFDFGADLLYGEEVFVFEHDPLLLGVAGGEDFLDLLMRAGDHVDANQFTDATGGGGTGVGGSLDGADVAAALPYG